ncbi:MAG: NUDIX hydrolase [Chitinophagaceae bacterium]|nr:NUDIX hydrolase [Chitinophagaceae bacterium]
MKIYFDNRPLFICNEITPEIEPYTHHKDAFLIDELSLTALGSFIQEMNQQQTHSGIIIHHDLTAAKKAFFKYFEVIQAAGGLVYNEHSEALFILRRGKWDLPKGKLDEGETLEECAIREVEEETGLRKIALANFLLTTYHTYYQDGKQILKESHWYKMEVTGDQELVPQTEEDITQTRWVKKEEWNKLLSNTFPSIKDVLLSL